MSATLESKRFDARGEESFADDEYTQMAAETEFYSGSDLERVTKAAAMMQIDVIAKAKAFRQGPDGRWMPLRAGEDKHELAEGDAIYFDSAVPHGYCRVGAKRTTALVVLL